MLHEIKIQKPYADAIMEGRKNFEVRKNDRGYNAGDRVQFTVVNAMGQRELHPLDDEIYIIKYIHSGLGLKEGYVVFGIEPQAESEKKDVMTYGDIYNEFCKKFPNVEVEDYRPAVEMHIPQLSRGIPNAIIVWLKDGSKVIFMAESED